MSAETIEAARRQAETADGPQELEWTRKREHARTLERAGWIGLMALAPVLVIYLSFNAGGYFPSANDLAAVVLAQALVLRTTLAERPFEGFSRTLAVPLAGLALYGAWQLLSMTWSHAGAQSLDSFDRTLLYLLALTLFGSVRYSPRQRRGLLTATLAGVIAVCFFALLSRLLPHLWPTAGGFDASRLNYPLTYWNAEGMLAAIALILCLHCSADPADSRPLRVLAAAATPALAATLLLTFSRGALGVAVIGLIAYCLLTRKDTLPGALLAVAPACAVAVRSAWDATLLASNEPSSQAAIAQGRHLALVIALCAAASGALRALLLPVERRLARLGAFRTPPRPAVRAVVSTALAAVVLAAVLALGGVGFAQRQYDHFAHSNTDAPATQTRQRLSEVSNNGRLSLWKAAVAIYHTDPLKGTGAGTYQLYYTRYRTEGLYVSDAHSLYLQSLAELGLVGLALILAVVLGSLAGLAGLIRGPERGLYAALFAATLAWALHQAFDWDWQMPAVSIVVVLLLGMALARGRDGTVGLRGLPAGRTLVALGWLALAVAPLLAGASYAHLHAAGAAMRRGDCASARHQALSSLSLSARRPQAYLILGVCDLEQGYPQAALAPTAQAAALEPQSWEAAFWLAVARASAGQDPHAEIARARALNPREGGLLNAARRLAGQDPRRWEAAAPRLGREALDSGKLAITSL